MNASQWLWLCRCSGAFHRNVKDFEMASKAEVALSIRFTKSFSSFDVAFFFSDGIERIPNYLCMNLFSSFLPRSGFGYRSTENLYFIQTRFDLRERLSSLVFSLGFDLSDVRLKKNNTMLLDVDPMIPLFFFVPTLFRRHKNESTIPSQNLDSEDE